MQPEHHFRKTKAGAINRNARLAGECYFEPAAETETVDHSHLGNLQGFEAVDHRMRPADRGLDRTGIGGAAKFIDIGAGNEAGWFCGANDDARRPLVLQRGQHQIKFLDQIGRQRVGAGVGAIEQQPGNPVAIAGQFEITIGGHSVRLRPEFEHPICQNVHDLRVHDLGVHGVPYTISISIAPPCPPPMHSVAMPRRVPNRFIALTRCSTMRLPLQPTGWPRLIAPPSTLSLARSICPAAPSRPKISRQNLSSFQAARHPSTCVAKAPPNSEVSTSPSDNLLRFRCSVADITGPSPMIEGSSAAHWLSTITAFGVRPCFVTASSEARMTQDAPSVICEELPAVTWPHGRSNTGLRPASLSVEESGRTPSS